MNGTRETKIKLATKLPVDLYILLVVIFALTVLMIYTFIKYPESAIDCIILYLLFIAIVYAYFGRYLSKINLYPDHIEVKYLFPWNNDKVFYFKEIVSMKNSELPFFNPVFSPRWFRNYQRLFLENEKGQTLNFDYHIDSSKNEILIKELQKQFNTEEDYVL